MATFSETFLCTALPAGVSGTKVRLAVLVSPRLTSDRTAAAALDAWPDARDWPDIQPTWTVTITQGNTTVTVPATDTATSAYDGATWHALFPGSMPNAPYVPEDRSTEAIASYPGAAIRDAIRNLHLEVLTTARTDFPTVNDLLEIPAFEAAYQAANQSAILDTALPEDPPTDATISLGDAFGMVEMFHGVRPRSVNTSDGVR